MATPEALMLGWIRENMADKKRGHFTKTIDFEVEGIEEATAAAPAHAVREPGKPFAFDAPKLEMEVNPQFQEPVEHAPKSWIFERRGHGLLAMIKRWLTGLLQKK